jgi:hypothetical protein
MTNRSFSRAFAAFVAVLLLVTAAEAAEKIRFTGSMVQDKRDGITIIGEKDSGLIAVTSLHFHYALMLPYAEDWTFTLEQGSLLRGNAGPVNLTLSAERNDETPGQHLERHKKDILSNPAAKGIGKIEVVTFKNEPVLWEVQDGEAASGDKAFRGVKIHHFFTAKRWEKDLYVLHLSKVVGPRDTLDEKLFLNMVTKGFNVDFMREKEKK